MCLNNCSFDLLCKSNVDAYAGIDCFIDLENACQKLLQLRSYLVSNLIDISGSYLIVLVTRGLNSARICLFTFRRLI